MAINRMFGIVMVVLGALLLWFISTGSLFPAPMIVFFAGTGAVGAVALGLWSLLGKY